MTDHGRSEPGGRFYDPDAPDQPLSMSQLREIAPDAVYRMLPELRERFSALLAGTVIDGSQAAYVTHFPFGSYAGRNGLWSLRASLDHLMAWQTLDMFHPDGLASITLLHSAQRNAFAALWLFEPGVTARERVRRGVLAELTEYDEERRFEECWGSPEPSEVGVLGLPGGDSPAPWETAAERYETLLRAARQGGLRLSRSDRPRPEGVPTDRSLFARYGLTEPRGRRGEQWAHHLMTGIEHGRGWATYYGTVRPSAGSRGAEVADPAARGLEQSGDFVPLLTVLAVNTAVRAVDAAEVYFTGAR
jgi:hypothetical protein